MIIAYLSILYQSASNHLLTIQPWLLNTLLNNIPCNSEKRLRRKHLLKTKVIAV